MHNTYGMNRRNTKIVVSDALGKLYREGKGLMYVNLSHIFFYIYNFQMIFFRRKLQWKKC